jgi:hypothetical protein
MGLGRLPVLFSVVLILAVLLVVTEGACLGATIFRGFPLAACLGHNGFLVITLAILFPPLGLLVDCLWSRLRRGRWPWDVADPNGSAT